MPKAQTIHGEIEYETVTCDSCHNEVMKKDASRFFFTRNSAEVKFGEYRTNAHGTYIGWACPHCVNVGPIDYPGRKYLATIKTPETVILSLCILCIMLLILLIVT